MASFPVIPGELESVLAQRRGLFEPSRQQHRLRLQTHEEGMNALETDGHMLVDGLLHERKRLAHPSRQGIARAEPDPDQREPEGDVTDVTEVEGALEHGDCALDVALTEIHDAEA